MKISALLLLAAAAATAGCASVPQKTTAIAAYDIEASELEGLI